MVGGGPAGTAAAVAAARQGAAVNLIEASGCLGGMLTGGLVSPILGGDINGGLGEVVVRRLEKYGAVFEPASGRGQNFEGMKRVLEELCLEAGVHVRYYTTAYEAVVEEQTVRGAKFASKAGSETFTAEIVVDGTGDGDIAAWAGAEYEKGDADGRLMPVTLRFTMANVDLEEVTAFTRGYYRSYPHDVPWAKLDPPQRAFGRFESLVAHARKQGELSAPDWGLAFFALPGRPGEVVFNNPYVLRVDGTQPDDLTRAQMEGRRYVFEIADFLKKYVTGFQNAYVSAIASLVGVRETRRIIGDYVLTAEDILSGRRFPDAIARNQAPIDLHSYDGSRTDETKGGLNAQAPPDFNEIPYRCLRPRGLEGILIAGRCLSSTREANSALRVTGNCFALGQAAGTAAAMAVQYGVSVRHLNVGMLQDALRKQGVNL